MNKKVIITTSIIGGIGILAYSIYYYVKTQTDLLKNFTYRILDLSVTTFNAQIVKGVIKINFTNNSDIEVAVNEFLLDFYFNGEYIGYLQDTTPFIIPIRNSTPISFEFTLNPQLILSNISDILLFSVKAKDATFSVRGKAKVKSGFISTTMPIEFDTTIKEILS